MPRNNNFLLGHGERLTSPVHIVSGGGTKEAPYSLQNAKTAISRELRTATRVFESLPNDSTPQNQVVAVITMHPRYVSKSDFPTELLTSVGLKAIGSRRREVKPRAWGIKKHPESAITEQLFVVGSKAAFTRWATEVERWPASGVASEQLTHIENVGAFGAKDKLKGIVDSSREHGFLEVILHNAGRGEIIESFVEYARAHGANPIVGKRRDLRGLTFIPVEIDFNLAEELAVFSFVRVARPLPLLRPLRPGVIRSFGGTSLQLPTEGPVDPSFRAVIFDGGLPEPAISHLSPWVDYIEPQGIGAAVPELQDHGLAVTGVLLFGVLEIGGELPRPISFVDHVRVLDDRSLSPTELDYVDALDRITKHLDANPGKYQFINISLGPRIPIDDDDVNLWTITLDDRLAAGKAVATIAAGNDGDLDQSTGRNRVQPPADGVNVIGVGSSDVKGDAWKRATYSCMGPGRTPGFVKPDGLAFGGSQTDPFTVLAYRNAFTIEGTEGTSVSSPLVLRSASAIRAQLNGLAPLAIRALILHRASPGSHARKEVGWGRFENNADQLITCEDNEVLVIYQGELPVGQHLRAYVPMPNGNLKGPVQLTATLVIAPEIDAAHTGAYTRSGLEVAFRPHADRYRDYPDGKKSKHPKTASFFSASNLYGASEYVLREEHYKWEPCLKAGKNFRSHSSLKNPFFDIYYHHREEATASTQPLPIPYALIVHLAAPKVGDLYNQVVRTYANVLVPLQPRVRIEIRS